MENHVQDSHAPLGFDVWCDEFLARVNKADLSLADPRNESFFRGNLRVTDATGAFKVAHVRGRPYQCRRTSRHLADGADDYYLAINPGVAGTTMMATFRRPGGVKTRTEVAPPGSCMLLTDRVPLTWRFCNASHGEFDLWSVRLARTAVLATVPDVDRWIGRTFAGGDVLRYLISQLHAVVAGPPTDRRLIDLTRDHLVDLMALILGSTHEAADVAATRGRRAVRHQTILDRIEAGLTDPGLSVAVVAGDVGISERYLQRLMEEAGETFCQYALRRRLERVGARLRRPAARRIPISQLAYAAGFNDLSYFNRVFKRHFGRTPGEMREARLVESADAR